MTDLRTALADQIGRDFEASGHNYSSYLIEIAADTAVAVIERWDAKKPVAKKSTKKPSVQS